uniref:Signal recognition particle receptor subunit beta n=1 Tax=Castor canadensis TaxID=51338 RepID=A0A8B7UQZ8_CASCN|nr:signal recognition particle receptor subunit beta isoform X2 [Castor canadensis]
MATVDSRRVGDGGGAGGTFQPYLDSLRQELQQRDPTLLSVVAALLVVLLTLVFWKFIWSRKSSQRAVLFVGLCDSGKTLLFVRLLTGHYRDTQTSITDSSAVYRVNNNRGNSLTLIDLPGHESLRLQFLDRFKSSARAVVFVVDSAAFQREVKDVAEFLYQVLIDSLGLKNTPSFLIACNKQDIAMAKSAKLIQQQLEKELTVAGPGLCCAVVPLPSEMADVPCCLLLSFDALLETLYAAYQYAKDLGTLRWLSFS